MHNTWAVFYFKQAFLQKMLPLKNQGSAFCS